MIHLHIQKKKKKKASTKLALFITPFYDIFTADKICARVLNDYIVERARLLCKQQDRCEGVEVWEKPALPWSPQHGQGAQGKKDSSNRWAAHHCCRPSSWEQRGSPHATWTRVNTNRRDSWEGLTHGTWAQVGRGSTISLSPFRVAGRLSCRKHRKCICLSAWHAQ